MGSTNYVSTVKQVVFNFGERLVSFDSNSTVDRISILSKKSWKQTNNCTVIKYMSHCSAQLLHISPQTKQRSAQQNTEILDLSSLLIFLLPIFPSPQPSAYNPLLLCNSG